MKSIKSIILFFTLILTITMFCGSVMAGDTPRELKEINLNGLTNEQVNAVFEILDSYNCPCPCYKGTVVECRNNTKCGTGRRIATDVVDRIRAGEPKANVSKIAQNTVKNIAANIKRKQEKYSKSYDINYVGSYVLGKMDAPLTLIVFLDFECPYCNKGYVIYNELVKAFPDDINFVLMHLPLRMHPTAVDYAAAAEAAGIQGKFFEMSALIFENRGKYSDEKVIGLAQKLGLDTEKFAKDLKSDKVRQKVFSNKNEAKRHGITATPTVIINKRMIRNKGSFDHLKKAVEAELKKIKK